jgi:hypothetical protein
VRRRRVSLGDSFEQPSKETVSSPRDVRRRAAWRVVVVVVGLVGLVGPAGLGTPAGAQQPQQVDRSNGSYAGTVWLVASTPDAEPAEQIVGVAIARLPQGPLERSFAVRGGDGEPVTGPAGEAVSELIGTGRTVIQIQVGPLDYDEVRHLVARWEDGEQEETPAATRVENLLDRVARTIGLKAPYRSVLSGSDPVAYLRDLARINGGG